MRKIPKHEKIMIGAFWFYAVIMAFFFNDLFATSIASVVTFIAFLPE